MSGQNKKLKMATQTCNHVSNTKGFEFHINPKVMITLYGTRFVYGNATAAEWHIINFDKLCWKIRTPNIDPGVLRVKLFPHSLTGLAKVWYKSAPAKDLKSWFNLRASFLEKFGESLDHQKFILDFKQLERETINQAWIRFTNLPATWNMG